MLSRRQIGHLVNDGDNGLMASEEVLYLLLFPPQDEFFFEWAREESLADLLRFERFSSCLRSELLLLLLFEK